MRYTVHPSPTVSTTAVYSTRQRNREHALLAMTKRHADMLLSLFRAGQLKTGRKVVFERRLVLAVLGFGFRYHTTTAVEGGADMWRHDTAV